MSAIGPSGEDVRLDHGPYRARIASVGAGLRTLHHGDRALLDGYGEREMCPSARGSILVPWPNRLRDGRYRFDGTEHSVPLSEPAKGNAIHGFTRWQDWSLAEAQENRAVFEHVLYPRDGYPFTLALSVEYALDDDGLTVTTRARNAGAQACPYGSGAHPYLTAGAEHIDACALTAPGAQRMVLDEQAIPTGREDVAGTPYDLRAGGTLGDLQLDSGFAELDRDDEGRAWVHLTDPQTGARTSLWLDARHRYLMLFTGDTLPDPERRRRSVGVEPMTCAPNAFASGEGLQRLEPGESTASSWGIAAGT